MTATIAPVGAARGTDIDVDADAVVELVEPPVMTSVTTRAAARETHGRPTSPAFTFDGEADTWAVVGLRAFLITVLTLGVCYPWALVMTQRWQADHTLVDGRRLRFTGTAREIFGRWIASLLLMVVTLGIFSFWVRPRLTRWVLEHQDVDSDR